MSGNPSGSHALSFRAPSRKTRIETFYHYGLPLVEGFLSERHPEKQGLKLISFSICAIPARLSERHPEKQGLKQPT